MFRFSYYISLSTSIRKPLYQPPKSLRLRRELSTINGLNVDSVKVKSPRPDGGVIKSIVDPLCNCDDPLRLNKCSKSAKCQYRVDQVPVYIKTYGCQMNTNDTAIISAILEDYGYKIVQDDDAAELYLLMTCAIRDSAESKIWKKINHLKSRKESKTHPLKQIGLLGCMAERLKTKVLEMSGSVDIVAGPDAYRDLPRLFGVNKMTNEKAINCLLSFDETYSDIRPVTKMNDVTAFVSITRGCDNLCSYCIVPFVRGRERSRSITTILDEIKTLCDKGIKEVTLLGQNVNSYRDLMTPPESLSRLDLAESVKSKEEFAQGFKTVYKPRTKGINFGVLLEEVARLNPELRIRFTSPHPKDFTDDVIEVIRKYDNIAKCIHLPAQSGSDSVLQRMRRGHTKQSYLDLVYRIRESIPDMAITSDFIAGFCGETEQDHLETLDLIDKVDYKYIFSFAYSQRDKTHAYHNLVDDIDQETKNRRSLELIGKFRQLAHESNNKLIGTRQLVLIERESKRSNLCWVGRADSNVKTIITKGPIFHTRAVIERDIKPGDYVECMITEANSQTLKGSPVQITSLVDFHDSNRQHISKKLNNNQMS